MTKKIYPDGTKFSNYFIASEGGKPCIRRKVTLPDGTTQQPRYPARLYKDLSTVDIQKLIDRLNHREDAEAKRNIEFRTAFIPIEVMDAFREHLKINTPNTKDFNYIYDTLLKTYFLGFFVGKLQIYDPQEWSRHQEKWAASLLSKSDNPDHNIFDRVVSQKTIKHVVQVSNRFMAFLKTKMPNDYPLIIFEPLGAGALKTHAAVLKLKRTEPVGRYIPLSDWKKIAEALPADIAPFIGLMYYYGLRRSESLGFDSVTSVKKGFLLIEKQMKTTGIYSILKDKENRRTPHWNAKPIDAYKLIEAGLDHKMHPDTLSKKFDKVMAKLKMDYKTHDLRRTFITSALRTQNARDVQLAVGHASLATTMAYAQDDRIIDEEIFDPKVG